LAEMQGITAVVLAAGSSRRMGSPKLLLPWKSSTILGEVVSTIAAVGILDILVVSQKALHLLDDHIQLLSKELPVRVVHNLAFKPNDMLTSLQYGLRAVNDSQDVILMVLGDQPQMQPETIDQLISKYRQTKSSIIIPSFQMRRGHPWLIARNLWQDLLDLSSPLTLRDFLDQHSLVIDYVIVDNDSILQDIDSPGDYHNYKPAHS
jgi:molybdenum cofactor cytidylyltransferase